MPRAVLFDITQCDFSQPVFTLEDIRQYNPQRYEMEMLTAVVYADPEKRLAVGYYDVPREPFWQRGHMPGFPLMPGVLICEAAAQLSSFYARYLNLIEGDFLAFGGLEHVRFRAPVFPGDRLVVIAQLSRIHRLQIQSHTQAFVRGKLVFEAEVIGVPFYREKRT
ncbi:MAG: 3-hydroxyacyl-ACP dehydratase FabZ family protein [Gemmatales bacterium]|nr:beta-hydroxyacyl-ACP dehydratase [Gemmatales bacterium]MCS7160870.1 beta-hydroxyacyl-ACP dehydratase [Gemmatales bacterium]MDW8176072.1 3-hydroxyacyl-ACP dehydratase FabZ family protein [Gemmatales bacterium]MDW8221733.1 3-hydroxyacyl-ACP dehydratase FabZ family protein [Gemmatales bacterium]